jgi:hypothetical protein
MTPIYSGELAASIMKPKEGAFLFEKKLLQAQDVRKKQ